MNRGELRVDLDELLHADFTQAHQDFTEAFLDKQLNRARVREVEAAKLIGVRRNFTIQQTFTWAADEATLQLPDWLQRQQPLAFRDITSSDIGAQISFAWDDYRTLRWGLNGPSSARTIRAISLGVGPDMEDDADEPMFIPLAHHELLVWSAAIQIRRLSDEKVPPSWQTAYKELQSVYQMYMAKGRPISDGVVVSTDRESVGLGDIVQDGSSLYGAGGAGVTF